MALDRKVTKKMKIHFDKGEQYHMNRRGCRV